VRVEIKTASFRLVRGYTVVAALLDEVAFWRTDETSANPDSEIIAALRPAMATVPNAVLLGASSPYACRGVLYESYRKHFAKDGDPILVWKAPSRTMNPSIPQSFIDNEYEKDPASASAEYGGEFRLDVESFLSPEAIAECVTPGQRELPYINGNRYVAFTDPSGGSQDSFTVAICHREDKEKIVLDAIREVCPPFSPESVVKEFCGFLKTYHVSKVSGDRYASEWPREQFRKYGVTYEPCETPKSDLYRDLLPLINSKKVELLDAKQLISQLGNLERRTARSGKDSIDHAPGAHDDIANAAAGAIWAVANKHGPMKFSPAVVEWASRKDPRTRYSGRVRAVPW
jgi:hypothetical protein